MHNAPPNLSYLKKPRSKSRKIGALAALAPFVRPYRGLFIAATLALLLTSFVSLILPIIVRHVVDNFETFDRSTVDQYFWGALILAGAFAASNALRFLLISQLGDRVVADIRKAVFDRVIEMSPAFYEKILTGEILSRITTDTTLVQSMVGTSLLMVLRNILTLLGGVILLFLTSVKLAIFVILVGPIVAVPIVALGLKIRKVSREAQAWIAASSGKASENLSAVQTVQSFTHEQASKTEFSGYIEASFSAARRRVRYSALLSLLVMFFVFGAIVVVLWLGARDVLLGAMSTGALVQFMIYAALVANSVVGLLQTWGQLQRAAGATERLIELLNAEDTISDPSNPDTGCESAIEVPVKGRIRFENVQFSYPSRPELSALDKVSFEILPGETVAFVGPSGAGKTTIIQLLQRFYDPQDGKISIDGRDLRSMERRKFRRDIALVPQDPIIFATSANDNIRFGRPGSSDADVESAARSAAVHEFLKNLPDGYESYLGERGIMLSGGQKQRVAIARAILRNAPILILDEATSALDAESEFAVQKAFDGLRRDRTTLVIAHRLATVKKADRIIVLDGGRVIATGTHEELVAAGGLYARLARLQFTEGMLGDDAAV